MKGRITTLAHPLKGISRPVCSNCLLSMRAAVISPAGLPSPSLSIARQYAKLGARSSPTVARKDAGRPTERLIFSAPDVPPLEVWERAMEAWHLEEGDLEGTTAQDCLDAARRYVAVATTRESAWRPNLHKDGLSPRLLHIVGGCLLQAGAPAQYRLGTHMLGTASELGHAPSTLTLVRIAVRISARNPQAAESALFRRAQARFGDLVRDAGAGAGPDALTLYGLVLAGRGQDAAALRAFAEAEKAAGGAAADGATPAEGGPRPRRWEWEPSCMLGRGRVLLRTGRDRDAEAAFRVAAAALDSPEGCYELARVLPPDAPEREAYLVKAAASGLTEACRELAAAEEARAQQTGPQGQGPGKEARARHERLAAEWRLLAA